MYSTEEERVKNRKISISKYKKSDKYKISIKKYNSSEKAKNTVKKYRNGTQKIYLRNLRKNTIEILGGKCVKCGFDDIRALQIDHINGGGSKERKEIGFNGSFLSNVQKSFLANENKYQLLCANCNWIKRFENNEIKK